MHIFKLYVNFDDKWCLYYIANMKYCVGIRLTFSHLTLANYNGQGQGRAYFNCEYLENGDRYEKHY